MWYIILILYQQALCICNSYKIYNTNTVHTHISSVYVCFDTNFGIFIYYTEDIYIMRCTRKNND